MHDIARFTPDETRILAGLLRQLIRADGRFTDEERRALSDIAMRVLPMEGDAPMGPDVLYAKIEEAAQAYAGDADLRAAAISVTRPEARANMHALLFEVAASDTISVGEAQVLDWLAEIWELETPRDLEGEKTDVG